MLTLKNLTLYTNEFAEQIMPNAYFLHTEDGLDWYFYQQKFASDTIKVAYDAKGIVRALSADASALWPVNLSVTEIAADKVAEGADESGKWEFNGEAVIARTYSHEELISQAENMRSELISSARETMQEWQTDLALGDIGDKDKEMLRNWNKYVKALKALDLNKAPDIFWPEVPLA